MSSLCSPGERRPASRKGCGTAEKVPTWGWSILKPFGSEAYLVRAADVTRLAQTCPQTRGETVHLAPRDSSAGGHTCVREEDQ